MSDNANPDGKKTGDRVIAGASYSVIGNLMTHGLAIISIAVLGRLLSPADFGIIAMATVFTGVSEALMNRQFDLALIRTKDIDESYFNTVFGISMIWGVFAACVLFLGAETFAGWMGEPALVPVLKVMCLLPLMDALRNPYFIMFERKLIFLPVVGVHLGSKLTQAAVAMGLAIFLESYWALVAGLLALSFARLVPTWMMGEKIPRPQLIHWRYFLQFGGWLSGTGLLAFVLQKSDTALVSRQLGATIVGFYNMGAELALMATHHLGSPLARMVYPGLATFADDQKRLNTAYYTSQQMILGFMLPLGVGVALVASELITVFVGTKWLPAVPVLQALAPTLALSSLTFNVQAILMVDGNTRAMFMRNLVVALVQVPLIIAGLYYYGFVGAIIGRVLATFLHTYLSLAIGGRLTGEVWWKGLTAGWRSLVAALAMSVAVLALDGYLPAVDGLWGAATNGAAKIALGALVYVASHGIAWQLAGRPGGFESRVLGLAGKILGRLKRG